METLKIMDFLNRKFDTEIPLKDIKELTVEVITGDEVIAIIDMNDCTNIIDAAEFGYERLTNYYDGEYTIKHADLRKWNDRKSTYEYLWKEICNG